MMPGHVDEFLCMKDPGVNEIFVIQSSVFDELWMEGIDPLPCPERELHDRWL